MNDLIIIGASGFGREVAWLVERINKQKKSWNLIGFFDDNEEAQNTIINGYKVLSNINGIKDYPDAYYICAVGASRTRKMLIERVKMLNHKAKFATLIDPSVDALDYVSIGEGSIICAGTIITVNVDIGEHVIVNLDCTIGHDAIIRDFVTLYPSVNVSGNTTIGDCTEIGTGTQIIQGKVIGDNSIVGAGSVVIRDLPSKCTAVGSPAKPIKFFE